MWIASKHLSVTIPDTPKSEVIKPISQQPFVYQGPLCSKISAVSVVCESHLIIDEKSPFLLYCLRVKTGYSKNLIKKKLENFKQLQNELLNLRNQTVLQH